MLKKSLLTLTAAATLLFPAGRADAAQLKVLVGGAMDEPIKKVGADYSRKTSNTLDYMVNTTGALQAKLRAGEKADIVIISSPGMDALEKEKLLIPGTRVALARALIGIAVRAGAASPDVSSVDAFKKAVLGAKSISYVDPKAGGTSGTYIAGLFQRLGIAEEMKKKTVFRYMGSEVAEAVAQGEADIGITFTSELAPNKGIKVAGTLPEAIQLPTVYAAAIPVGAAHPDAARAFLKDVKAPEGQTAIREAGLEPIR
jgi:molybdate transport system substrate-binding protein